MIKRIISLFLILFLTGNLGIVSAEKIQTENEYEKAYRVLESIGVFERCEKPGKAYDETLTRSEFISMYISAIFPGYENYNSSNAIFTDVGVNDKYIYIASELGIISGDGNGAFRPNDTVKYEEALKIVVSILGYSIMADSDGGFPSGYYKVAERLELDKKIPADSVFSYGDALILMLNVLNAQVNEIKNITGSNEVTFHSGETLMYNVFKVRYGKGILTENNYTTLTSPKNHNNQIVIGDFKGSLYGKIEAENYLGYEVEYYCQEEEADDVVLYINPTKTNEVIYITSEDDVSVSDRTVNYYSAGKNRMDSEVIPASAKVIYNGKAYPEYTMSIFNTKDADFQLIDNNKDNKIDVINVTAWGSIYIDGIDVKNERLIDKYDSASLVNLEDAENWIIWNSDFEELDLSELAVGSVGNVVKSLDGQYVRIIIVDDKKMGVVTSIPKRDGYTYISLDGVEYAVSESYLNKGGRLPVVGEKVTLCLDYTGRIAAIDGASDSLEYGYLIKSSKNEYDPETKLHIKLLKSNGVVSTVDTAEKFKVDGDKYTDELFARLSTPQVVRYRLNDENVLVEIDTIEKGLKESKNSLRALTELVNMKYYPQQNIFAGSGRGNAYDSDNILYCMLVAGTNTKLVITPKAGTAGVTDEDYMIQPLTYFTGSANKIFQGFNANSESYIPDVVYMQNDGGGNLSRGDNPALVTNVTTSLNSDEEQATLVTLVNYSGTEKSVFLSKAVEAKGISVAVGDFINYSIDIKNNITDINIVYSNELRDLHPNNKYGTKYYGSDFNPHYGKVYDREGNTIVFTTKKDLGSIADKDLQFVPVTNSMSVYVVEKARNGYSVKKGTVNDIYDYSHYGMASDVFFYTFQTIGRMMVVYR